MNPKNTGSTYIKSDANTLWARNAARRAKEPAPVTEVRTNLYFTHSLIIFLHIDAINAHMIGKTRIGRGSHSPGVKVHKDRQGL